MEGAARDRQCVMCPSCASPGAPGLVQDKGLANNKKLREELMEKLGVKEADRVDGESPGEAELFVFHDTHGDPLRHAWLQRPGS